MKLLLVQSSVYVPTLGGANKSNRLLCEALAARGHDCMVVAPACGVQGYRSRAQLHEALERASIPVAHDTYADRFVERGVQVCAVADPSRLYAELVSCVRQFMPDLLLVASEDPGHFLLEAAVRLFDCRVVYLARTTLALPFGPHAAFTNSRGLDLLRRVGGIVAVSRYLESYFARWAGLTAVALPISLHGDGPFPLFGNVDGTFVTMVNPCVYKGLSIFVELARANPDVRFAAVPTWGTTRADRHRLEQISNVHLLPPADDIDDILSATRVLLVPSLWAEAKSRLITEALLRGVPVLASDVGGNNEAMLGCDHLLPVTPIDRFEGSFDEQMLPIAVDPPQDVEPWQRALRELIGDPERYRQLSSTSRRVAMLANERHTVMPFENFLTQVLARSAASIVS